MSLIDEFMKPKKKFLLIKEGNLGLECYADNELNKLTNANKKLIKAFLEGVIQDLK